MIGLLTVIHVIICILLIITILLQSSKGGGMAGIFGGGGAAGGVFGGRGAASFLSKTTMWLGIIFALTSVSIGLISARSPSRQKSLVREAIERENVASPADILPTVPGGGDAIPENPSPENSKP
jgi:preprotein translocase subunit SecG